jgi:hypothetical protein
LIGVGALVLAALVYGVIRFDWGWTGFAGGYSQVTVKGTTEDKVYLTSKTLWDWMQLLLVPMMLAIGASGSISFKRVGKRGRLGEHSSDMY